MPSTYTMLVPPGRDTGVYYIPVANLAFQASWQHLKDFVKPVAEVDHVEIFRESTSGWIRVTGYENFRAAFHRLDGGIFLERAIIASDRNAENAITIRGVNRNREEPASAAACPPAAVAAAAGYGAGMGPSPYGLQGHPAARGSTTSASGPSYNAFGCSGYAYSVATDPGKGASGAYPYAQAAGYYEPYPQMPASAAMYSTAPAYVNAGTYAGSTPASWAAGPGQGSRGSSAGPVKNRDRGVGSAAKSSSKSHGSSGGGGKSKSKGKGKDKEEKEKDKDKEKEKGKGKGKDKENDKERSSKGGRSKDKGDRHYKDRGWDRDHDRGDGAGAAPASPVIVDGSSRRRER